MADGVIQVVQDLLASVKTWVQTLNHKKNKNKRKEFQKLGYSSVIEYASIPNTAKKEKEKEKERNFKIW
jgi:hypothetical protein